MWPAGLKVLKQSPPCLSLSSSSGKKMRMDCSTIIKMKIIVYKTYYAPTMHWAFRLSFIKVATYCGAKIQILEEP